MSGRRAWTHILVGAGWTVVALVLCCLWGLGSFQLAVRGHPTGFGAAWPVALLWALLSLFVFVLATGGIVVLIVLVTWGYVSATREAMIRYDNTALPE